MYIMGAWSLSLLSILGGSYKHCYIHVAEWWVAIFYSIKKINLHICTQWYLSQGHELTAHSTRFHHWPWSELMPSYSFLQSYILSYFCVYVHIYIYTAENRCIPNYGRQAVVEDNILLKILIGRTLSKITISKLSQGSWYIYIYAVDLDF